VIGPRGMGQMVEKERGIRPVGCPQAVGPDLPRRTLSRRDISPKSGRINRWLAPKEWGRWLSRNPVGCPQVVGPDCQDALCQGVIDSHR
jgi:hypothetical protein